MKMQLRLICSFVRVNGSTIMPFGNNLENAPNEISPSRGGEKIQYGALFSSDTIKTLERVSVH